MMHAQAKSEKESDEKMTMITQAKLCGGQTIVIKESLYTATVNSGHLTPKKTASYWTTDQR
jgi:hypothetical protein